MKKIIEKANLWNRFINFILRKKKFEIRTFEETMLTKEERLKREIEKKKDLEDSKYYKEILNNPEKYLIENEEDLDFLDDEEIEDVEE